MSDSAPPVRTDSAVVQRGAMGAFCAAAALLLAYLFRDAWLHGYVLGQADILFEYLPWKPHRPVGLRAANRLFHDVPTVFYPFMYHARHAVLNGEFPLWSTAIGAGHPFFASFQSAVLSPFTLFVYALPFPAALTAEAAARLFAGGLGMFLYLRALTVGPAGATFGGIAFLLNAFSIVWLEHPLSAAAASLPWMLLAVEVCVRRGGLVATAGMAVATGFALLTGHPETAFKVALLAGAYAIYRGLANGCFIRAMVCVAGGMVLGVLLAAIQVLPFLEYVRESRTLAVRAEGGGPLFTNPLVSVVTTFVPEFFATPIRNRYVLPGGNYAEQQVYPGIVTWVLAIVSLTHRRFRGLAVFFLSMSLAAMLVMYGTPVADFALALVPPLRYAALSRFGLIAIVGAIVAAAIGVDALVHAAREDVRRWRTQVVVALITSAVIASVVVAFLLAQRSLLEDTRQWQHTMRGTVRAAQFLAAVVAATVASRWLPGWVLRVGPAALIALELLVFSDGLHPMIPRERSFPPLSEVATLRQDGDIFRVAGWSQTLLPNTAMVYGVQDFRSYDGIGIRHYSALLDAGFHFNGAAHEFVNFASTPLLDLLNVKYLLLPSEVDVPPAARERFHRVLDGPTRVYLNRAVLPRAFLVDRLLRTTEDVGRRMLRDGFDMRRLALVDRLPADDERPQPATGQPGDASIVEYANHRVVVRTRADGARLLVLTDVFYPGWRAEVDGKEAAIYRANHAFRGVPVPAGEHTVTFRYEPRSFMYGRWISGIAVLIVVGLTLVGRRSAIRRRAPLS